MQIQIDGEMLLPLVSQGGMTQATGVRHGTVSARVARLAPRT